MAKKNYVYGGKATAVLEWLNTEPSATDAHIAKHVGCHPTYVKQLRKKMIHAQPPEEADADFLYKLSQGKQKRKAEPTHQFIEISEEVTRELSNLLNAKPGEYIVVDGAKSPQEIDAILNERGSHYGSFEDVASLSQQIKSLIGANLQRRGKTLAADQFEALDMISSKLARIVNGDPDYVDSWTDIAGYAKLVADRLQGVAR